MKYVDGMYSDCSGEIDTILVFVYFLFGLLIPAVAVGIVLVDSIVFHTFDPSIHAFLLIVSATVSCMVGISVIIISACSKHISLSS